MSWDLDAPAQGATGTKKEFTQFPEGTTLIRVLSSKPNMRWTHWMPYFQRNVTCPSTFKGCPICEVNNRLKVNKEQSPYGNSRRYAMNVFNHGTGKLEIMDEGITFMRDLQDVNEEILKDKRPLLDSILQIRKRGTGREGTYRIADDGSKEMSDDEKEAFEAMTDLDEYYKPHDADLILKLILAQDESVSDKDKKKETWNNIMTEHYKSDEEDSDDDALPESFETE